MKIAVVAVMATATGTSNLINQIKTWRALQTAAGLPASLDDYYNAHDLCPECHGRGYGLRLGQRVIDHDTMTWHDTVLRGASCKPCNGTGRYVNNHSK